MKSLLKSALFNLNRDKGFTLVELLVVIVIIAIIAAAVALIINPLEIKKRGEDTRRVSELASLRQAIDVALQEATGSNILCDGAGTECNGTSYPANSSTRKVDGSGWVKVDIGAQTVVTLPALPIDPINSAANHYIYCAQNDKYEINAVLTSTQQSGQMGSDGGDDPAKYEVGNNFGLVGVVANCTY